MRKTQNGCVLLFFPFILFLVSLTEGQSPTGTILGVVKDENTTPVSDAVIAVIAPDCSYHDPRFPVEGLAGIKQRVLELRAAQPDLHTDVHDVLVDGDMTATRWTQQATASGEFRGVPATGRTYAMDGVTIDRWEDDRIVEVWMVYDLFGALEQLGVIPETPRQDTTS